MSYLKGFGRFWYGFIVGEDWRIAAGVTVILAAGAALASTGAVRDAPLVVLVAVAIAVVVVASVGASARGASTVDRPQRPR